MSTRPRALVILVLAYVLAGCAELNSIHRTSKLPAAGSTSAQQGRVITVDAKQRHLLALPEFENNSQTRWRVCAEAAPDVFSAYAASGGAKGNKDGGEISFGAAETAASLERTQTINLFRESLYRTCERYASGAINRTQFIIQAARDQRAMVAVLSIEQLTGAVRPKSTIITGPGTAASTISGADAAALVNDYNKRLKTAEGAQEAAKSAVEKAGKDGGVCAEGEKKDEAACTALKLTHDQSKKDVVTAQAGLDNAVKLAKDLVTATSATTFAGTNSQGGGVDLSDINQNNLAAIADAVVEINKISQINEPLMFCIGYLSDQSKGQLTLGNPIIDTCLDLIVAKQNADQKSLGMSGLNPINRKIGQDAANVTLENERNLGTRTRIINLTCGHPKTDKANFQKIIEEADKVFPDSSWKNYIGKAEDAGQLYQFLENSTFAMQETFLDTHFKICGGKS